MQLSIHQLCASITIYKYDYKHQSHSSCGTAAIVESHSPSPITTSILANMLLDQPNTSYNARPGLDRATTLLKLHQNPPFYISLSIFLHWRNTSSCFVMTHCIGSD